MYAATCVVQIDASIAYPSHEHLHHHTQSPCIRPRRTRRPTPANASLRGSTPKPCLASSSISTKQLAQNISESIRGFISNHHHRHLTTRARRHNPLPTSSLFPQLLATAVACGTHRRTDKKGAIFVLRVMLMLQPADLWTVTTHGPLRPGSAARRSDFLRLLFITQHYRFTASPATHITNPARAAGWIRYASTPFVVNSCEGSLLSTFRAYIG